MNKKWIILRFLCAAVLLSGLGLILYPSVNAWLEDRRISRSVEAFRGTAVDISPQPVLPGISLAVGGQRESGATMPTKHVPGQ